MIGLVTNGDNWTWDSIADDLIQYGKGYFAKHPSCKHAQRAGCKSILQFSWMEADVKFVADNPDILHAVFVASEGPLYDWPAHDVGKPALIATKLRNRQAAQQRLQHFDVCLSVNDQIHKEISQYANSRRVLIGVDVFDFVPSRIRLGGQITIGWCGQRGGATKGFEDILIPLMPRVPFVDWRINLRDHTDALNRYMMRISFYDHIDVFLSTSCSEGCQMTIAEALACGVPVIATDVGAARDVITKDCGVLVPAYTNEDGAAKTRGYIIDAIELIRDDLQTNLQRMAFAARDHAVECLSWQHIAQNWVDACTKK